MRPDNDVREVFRLAALHLSQSEIARRSGIPRATVRDWLKAGETNVLASPMRKSAVRRSSQYEACSERCPFSQELDEPAYAYLLGQYLGDGCISQTRSALRLRIVCCSAYPQIMAEVADAIVAIKPGANVGYITSVGCTEVYSTWTHWPCLLPHGPGRKHLRKIELKPWQTAIALDRHPGRFVRGLIHSDGCRSINRVTARGRKYEYVRYLFANESADILDLFMQTCERLGVSARYNNRNSISIARKDSVRRLEEIVGPKT